MSTSTIAKASRVERAVERLEAAVDRLDVALASAPPNGGGTAGDGAALDALRRENAELKDLNRDAADRLSAAIRRLQGLLDDGAGT